MTRYNRPSLILTCGVVLWATSVAAAQVEISGRLEQPVAGREAPYPFTEIRSFASRRGPRHEPRSFRTWEMPPAGWFRFGGMAGNHTLLFTEPSHFMRPVLVTNVFMRDGDRVNNFRFAPAFYHHCYEQSEWDPEGTDAYYQPFVARGDSVTQVGFKLATDGIDGGGPLARPVQVTVHRVEGDDVERWPRVGPAGIVPHVDCGGPKSYHYSVGWNSGEVPVERDQVYAVRLATLDPKLKLQAFWTKAARLPVVRRDERGSPVRTDKQIWLTVAGDGDGLVIPLNKRVHKPFNEFAGSGRTWTQTYVAQGRGLAGIVCYAAVSGAQPPLSRQRVRVTVRRDGPRGEPVGVTKLAVGEGHYTGDASWGVFATAVAPGEIPLVPGHRYAIEMTSVETEHTLGGFVNIKGQVSDGRAAFNPYRRHPDDPYPLGSAFENGRREVDFDLDMQVIEYLHHRPDWARAVEGDNLLSDRDWIPGDSDARLSLEARTIRLAGHDGEALDRSLHQRIVGLDSRSTYVVRARVRCTWPTDVEHVCRIGVDAGGATPDAHAESIRWFSPVTRHGQWIRFTGPPIRPKTDNLTVWLGARSKEETKFPFVAEFRDLELRATATGAPRER